MAYSNKAKLKALYLKKILEEETDENHGLTMPQIIDRLAAYGIEAERKSVYRDIEALREFYDIQTYQRSPVEYAMVNRGFSMPNLMLMVDAVQSCKALTTRQCNALVNNIKLLASDYQKDLLDHTIHVPGRIHTKSAGVFENVDAIQEAIRARRKVEFPYFKWDAKGERQQTNHGKPHVVTPIRVVYDEGFYYLTAYNDAHENIADYRLDRMGKLRVSEERATQNETISANTFDESEYLSFGRFGGEEATLTLRALANKTEIIKDRFGNSAEFFKSDENYAWARVKVKVSDQFYGWLAGLDKKVVIDSPASQAEKYRAYLQSLLDE